MEEKMDGQKYIWTHFCEAAFYRAVMVKFDTKVSAQCYIYFTMYTNAIP